MATAAAAGTIENDGNAFYATTVASTRQVVLSPQFALLQSTYTLTSTTAAQKIFNVSSTGAVTLAPGTYEFVLDFSLSSMSSTSGSFGVTLGGTATVGAYAWNARALKVATLATASSASTAFSATASLTSVPTASTATNGWCHATGVLVVTSGGTVIPQVTLGVAAAAVVGVGSRFEIYPLGSSTTTKTGNWN